MRVSIVRLVESDEDLAKGRNAVAASQRRWRYSHSVGKILLWFFLAPRRNYPQNRDSNPAKHFRRSKPLPNWVARPGTLRDAECLLDFPTCEATPTPTRKSNSDS